jgi:hypothetical protein
MALAGLGVTEAITLAVDGVLASPLQPALALWVVFSFLICFVVFAPAHWWQARILQNFGRVTFWTSVGSMALLSIILHGQDLEVNSDFYATVAQVLPVLLLATLIDAGLTKQVTRTQVGIFTGVLITGEMLSLACLAFNVSYWGMFTSVSACTLGAFAGVIACVTVGRLPGSSDEVKQRSGVDELTTSRVASAAPSIVSGGPNTGKASPAPAAEVSPPENVGYARSSGLTEAAERGSTQHGERECPGEEAGTDLDERVDGKNQ